MLEQAVRHCLARLTDFSGRTSRDHYMPYARAVLFPVTLLLIFLALGGMDWLAGSGKFSDSDIGSSGGGTFFGASVIGGALILYAVATMLLVAATVRRLHDVGMSGWWYVGLQFVPFLIGPIMALSLRRPGDARSNQYGPAPEAADWSPEALPADVVDRVEARFAALLEERAAPRPPAPHLLIEPAPAAPIRTFGRRGLSPGAN